VDFGTVVGARGSASVTSTWSGEQQEAVQDAGDGAGVGDDLEDTHADPSSLRLTGRRLRGLVRRGAGQGPGPGMRGGAISRSSRIFVSILSRFSVFRDKPSNSSQ
jgi:hypothetical protein